MHAVVVHSYFPEERRGKRLIHILELGKSNIHTNTVLPLTPYSILLLAHSKPVSESYSCSTDPYPYPYPHNPSNTVDELHCITLLFTALSMLSPTQIPYPPSLLIVFVHFISSHPHHQDQHPHSSPTTPYYTPSSFHSFTHRNQNRNQNLEKGI